MPNPSILGQLLGVVLVFCLVGPSLAGLSILVTKRPRTVYFWIFAAVYAGWGAWYLAGVVTPEKVFQEVFHVVPGEDVVDLDFETDHQPQHGVFLMCFRASPSTVQRARGMRAMKPTTSPSLDDLVPAGLDVPAWWPLAWAAGAEVHHGIGSSKEYRYLDEWMFHDPETGAVVYVMVGQQR